MTRILVGGAVLGMIAGVAMSLPCPGERPLVSGLGSPQMSYFLANQALFSGDADAALEFTAAVSEAGVEPASLCPSVPMQLEMRGGMHTFCNPDAVTMPASVEAWIAGQKAEASERKRQGDIDGALEHLDQVLAANPYDLGARELLVAWLGEQGDGEAAAEHRQRLQAMREGRVLSLERLPFHRI